MGGPHIHVGDHMILVPYKVRGTIFMGGPESHIVHVGGPYNTNSI